MSVTETSSGESIPADREPEVAVAEHEARPWHERSLPLVALFLLIGSGAFFFTIRTVNHRPSAELGASPYARRSHRVIDHWLQNGYFRSGGMMFFSTNDKAAPFYYRSTGSYMISGFLIEKLHVLTRGRYNWRLLGVHNQILSLVLSALASLLAYRIARRFGLDWLPAVALAAAVDIVVFTFPDNLGLYWEYYAQPFGLIFAVLFLLLEERSFDDVDGHGYSWPQVLVATALGHAEFAIAFFFFVSYAIVLVILNRGEVRWKALLMKTAVPFALAMMVFALQHAWVRSQYPDTKIEGSSFIFRSGLDGSTQYYRNHLDIALGRDLARRNFRFNHEYLLTWKWLFAGGVLAVLAILAGYLRSRTPRFVIVAIVSMLGSYVLYAALFSQAVTIHPYLYDVVLVTPLILALFAAAPALVESLSRYTGTAVLIVLFAALWYAMVQMRSYALRYPTAEAVAYSTPAAPAKVSSSSLPDGLITSGAIYERGRTTAVGEWIPIPYDPSFFTADRGARWDVDRTGLNSFSYSYVGKTMTMSFRIDGSSVSGGPPTLLKIAIPEQRRAARTAANAILVRDGGEMVPTFAQVVEGMNVIQIPRPPTGLFTEGRNQTMVVGQITFEVR